MQKGFTARGKTARLLAKCWDLASAYNQVPLSDEAHELDSYIVVYNPSTGQPEIYQQSVLPFGSVASVTFPEMCTGNLGRGVQALEVDLDFLL